MEKFATVDALEHDALGLYASNYGNGSSFSFRRLEQCGDDGNMEFPKTKLSVGEAGLDRGKAEVVLNGNQGMDALKDAGERSRQFHVNGVPFFIVNGRMTLSGAQSSDTFIAAFKQAGDSN